VTQPHPEKLENTLMDVSDPESKNYGNHLSRQELKKMMKPRSESSYAVMNWLRQAGVAEDDIQNDGEWINFVTSVDNAGRMMETEFFRFQSTANRDIQKIRTLEYSIPSELTAHIDLIQPTTRFGQIRPQFNTVHRVDRFPELRVDAAAAADDCNKTITPDCLRDLYNVKGFTPNAKHGFLGVNGFLKEYARFDDLKAFAKKYDPKINADFDWQSVNGGKLPQDSTDDSVEANLDIQYTVAMSNPVPNTFYSTPGLGKLIPDLDQPTQADNQNEPYLDFFTYLTNLDDDKLPMVLTTSYGEDEQSVPERYAKKVCDMIGQLGTRGVSVLFSSGDTGPGSACQTNDGKNTTRFLPTFPASCPYVTSVGGTYQIDPEVVVDFSSGGFSDRYPTPKYQKKAVKGYLDFLGNKWDGLYNPAGRGIPDVAAQGYNFHVMDKGKDILVGGTSASAPAFAGIVALLNNALLTEGKHALGFLNPWLYANPDVLNDVTEGKSKGCTGKDIYSGLPAPKVKNGGWDAAEAWDAATGLGTPNFGKMLKSAKKASGKQ